MLVLAAAATESGLTPIMGGELPLAKIALGLMLGLLGWPLYAAAVRLIGALVGVSVAIAAVVLVNEFRPLEQMLLPILIGASIAGIFIGLWLFKRLVTTVWFLMGASLGVLAVWTARERLLAIGMAEWTPLAQAALWAGASLGIALLTVWLKKWLVAGATAALGAGMLAPHLEGLGPPTIAWWSAGAAGFFAIQIGLHRMVGLDREGVEDYDEERR